MIRHGDVLENRCPSWQELASSFLARTDRFAAHRRRCEACAGRWRRVRSLSVMLQEAEEIFPALSGPCPDAADWAALAEQAVAADQRHALVAHLAACERCAALWNYLCDVVEEVDSPPPAAAVDAKPDAERSPPSRRVRWLLAAAGLAGLLVFLAYPPPPVESGGGERWRGPATRLATEARWPPGSEGPVLRWQRSAEASGYRLQVWDSAGNLVIRHLLAPSIVEWKLEPQAPTAKSYYWLLEALREGRVIARSDVKVVAWSEQHAASPRGGR
ncbi:MAG: hypothetical protein ACE5HV_02975 [Acidobacteriota bacterium]